MSLVTSTLKPVLMAAVADGEAPEWVHLIPAGKISTLDKRGPYYLRDADALIARSFAQAPRLPVDENHAIDLAAPKGLPAPARGWLVAMEAREDGIWGQVEWTAEGRDLVVGKAYRGVSPVIVYNAQKEITSVLRASLVNEPNLRELTALHQKEGAVSFMQKLAEALGLTAEAGEEQVLAALAKLKDAAKMADEAGAKAVAAQSKVSAFVSALGAGDEETALQAAEAAKAGDAGIKALQATVRDLTTQLNTVQTEAKQQAATDFVDAAIREGRVGVKPLRDHYIARHMADRAAVEKELSSMPLLGASGLTAAPPSDGKIALNAAQRSVAKSLGIPEEDFVKHLSADKEDKETF